MSHGSPQSGTGVGVLLAIGKLTGQEVLCQDSGGHLRGAGQDAVPL